MSQAAPEGILVGDIMFFALLSVLFFQAKSISCPPSQLSPKVAPTGGGLLPHHWGMTEPHQIPAALGDPTHSGPSWGSLHIPQPNPAPISHKLCQSGARRGH